LAGYARSVEGLIRMLGRATGQSGGVGGKFLIKTE